MMNVPMMKIILGWTFLSNHAPTGLNREPTAVVIGITQIAVLCVAL